MLQNWPISCDNLQEKILSMRMTRCVDKNGHLTWHICLVDGLNHIIVLYRTSHLGCANIFLIVFCGVQVIMCTSKHLGSPLMTPLSCIVQQFLQHQENPTKWFVCSSGITCMDSM